jgi:hypothetical protein
MDIPNIQDTQHHYIEHRISEIRETYMIINKGLLAK